MNILASMWGRVFALLLLGVMITAGLTSWLALGEREKTLSQFRETHSIDRVEQLVRALDVLPTQNRAQFLATAPRLGLQVTKLTTGSSSGLPRTEYARAVSERLGKNFRVFSLTEASEESCPYDLRDKQKRRVQCEALGITLNDGTTLKLVVMPPRTPAPPVRQDFIQYVIILIISIGILAYLIARMTMRPLQQMAAAASALGQDINRPALNEQGGSEIRQATRAFNAMQAQIRQHIAQRTHMLAAITHDLQTPLTRLRLRLEKVQDADLKDRLIGDLSAMQMMIREGLDLARSMDSQEQRSVLDLHSLLDSVCTDATDAGQDVRFNGKPGYIVLARPQALRRCLTNLIDNAVKYGHYAEVSLEDSQLQNQSHQNLHIARMVHVLIRDGGPGIPEDYQQQVFEPFFRMETSRSRDSGGTGLGMTIAQNIAQQHQGTVQLRNLSPQGLEVRLSLPLQ